MYDFWVKAYCTSLQRMLQQQQHGFSAAVLVWKVQQTVSTQTEAMEFCSEDHPEP